MNTVLEIVNTFGDTDPFISTDIVKQDTSLGPSLNNCSLSDICGEGYLC